MDRKTILAIVIITLILIAYPYYIKMISPPPKPQLQRELTEMSEKIRKENANRDSMAANKPADERDELPGQSVADENAKKAEEEKLNIVEDTSKVVLHYENKKIAVTLSNRDGANITSWLLKGFEGRNNNFVEMVDNNYFAIQFNDWNGDFIDLSRYSFFYEGKEDTREGELYRFYLPYKEGKIRKDIIFENDSYSYKMIISFEGLEQNFIGKQYSLTWMNGLPPAEHVITEDGSYASSQVRIAGDLEIYRDAGDEPETIEGKNIQWGASRIKYFTVATVPLQKEKVYSVKLFGEEEEIGESKFGRYSYAMNVRHLNPVSTDSFLVYMGPLNYEILEAYNADLEDMVLGSSGYERFFRPFSLFLLKILKLLHAIIPNYGVAIIVFSILLKLVLFPFTKSSYKSMKAMQKLQPQLKELKEKYPDNPQMIQKKTMELYKEHKVNPLGGCLPMLLQMPVLFAMYIVFRSTVQLRGEAFFGWISDLSRPDVIATLPFSIPLYGDQLTLLPVLMALSMFFQQKQTVQDPSQKFMIYFFPVMMLFIFNQFPSGLNLYYTVFNVLTIAQQHLIKINEDEFKLNKPKKGGLAFSRKKKK